jgi:hypothetical protein
MTDDSQIVTHSDPAWRDRTNFIVRLDLAPYDEPGRYEQCWTRTEDQRLFEMCCIPFFTYGISLGDLLEVNQDTGAHSIHRKSGRRTIRVNFLNDEAAHREHHHLHDALVGPLGCLGEFHGPHYAAIDLANDQQASAVIDVLTPLFEVGSLIWEWADPTLPF